jgi:hypothetical protein
LTCDYGHESTRGRKDNEKTEGRRSLVTIISIYRKAASGQEWCGIAALAPVTETGLNCHGRTGKPADGKTVVSDESDALLVSRSAEIFSGRSRRGLPEGPGEDERPERETLRV